MLIIWNILNITQDIQAVVDLFIVLDFYIQEWIEMVYIKYRQDTGTKLITEKKEFKSVCKKKKELCMLSISSSV